MNRGAKGAGMRVFPHRWRGDFRWVVVAVVLAGLLSVTGPCLAAQTQIAYRVAFRGVAPDEQSSFATTVARVYDDPRGWSLDGQVKFVRVTAGGEFTIWLAAADEMSSFSTLCAAEWSCRVGHDVVINDERWASGSPYWHGDLTSYRTMVINHETGHFLGLDHAPCPHPGALAPVMMQQSKGTSPCLPNGWPLASERALAAHHLGWRR
jgi:hypothetical protein